MPVNSVSVLGPQSVNQHLGKFFPHAKQTLNAVRRQSNSRLNLTTGVSHRTLTVFEMPEKDRTIRVPASKSSFMSVFKVFRAWQRFVKHRKAQSIEKKRLLHLIVQAINFSEHGLLAKSLRGFRLVKMRTARLAHLHALMKARHVSALLRFYLKTMIDARLEHQLIRHLSQIALHHRIKTMQQQVYSFWNSSVK